MRQWCDAEGLSLHPSKTKLVAARTEGFDFLDYHFTTAKSGDRTRWPRTKSLAKLKATIRAKAN